MDFNMEIEELLKAIQMVNITLPDEKTTQVVQEFIKRVESITLDKENDIILKTTRITILLEGFYRSLDPRSKLKEKILAIRMERWSNHFGTPTVPFLISYQNQIKQTSDLFKHLNEEKLTHSLATPWLVTKIPGTIDVVNSVIVDMSDIDRVDMPEFKEKTGQFTKTHNPSGGFTTTPCDPFSKEFIEYAISVAKDGGRVLEVGAAFGAASIQALEKGVTVFCNDIEPQNLAVIRKRCSQELKLSPHAVTGDDTKLVLIPGSFPDELCKLPIESFDAILACRVLHFFPGKKIEQSLELMSKLLKPGGKLFIVCETPFLKNWQKFIPEYARRVSIGMEWPGEITNPAEFESSGRAATLPHFVHWVTKEILKRSLSRLNFSLSRSSYINRLGQFPADLLLDGKESVGAVANKQIRCRL